MNPASVDIKALLIKSGTGLSLTFGTNLFIGSEPSTPDNCVTIFDTPGYPPDRRYAISEAGYSRPSIQIRVRNRSYTAGWELIHNIVVLLHNQVELVGTTQYTAIFCSQEPALLDLDENRRARFVTTFDLQRRDR